MDLLPEDLRKENERLKQIREFDEKATGKFIDEFVSQFRKLLKGKVPDSRRKAHELAIEVVLVLHFKENLVLRCKLMTYSINVGQKLFNSEQQKKYNHRTEIQPPSYFDSMAAEDDIYEMIEESELKLWVQQCLKKMSEKCQKLLRKFMIRTPSGDASKELGYASKSIYQVRKNECLIKLQNEVLKSGDQFNLL